MNTNQIIDALGGTAEVARMCNVTAGAVSQWKEHDRIPPARLMYLRLLRPDVFAAVDAEQPQISNHKEAA